MSLRIDTSEWISGALVIGDVGGGVLAEDIPSTGDAGPPYAYNDLTFPADNGKEICGRITTWPAAGTLFAYEDTSFTFIGAPNGTYTFQYQLYADYVAIGSPATVTLNVGATAVAGAAAWTEANDAASLIGLVGNVVGANIAWTEADDTTAALATIRVDASIGWAEAADTAGLNAELLASGAISWTEASDSASISASVAIDVTGAMDWTEANDTAAITAAVAIIYARAPSGSGYRREFSNTTRPAQQNTTRNPR